MSRKDRTRSGRIALLAGLLDGGDHLAAARAARAALADPDATDAERDAARAALAGLRPEPAALLTGLAGLGVAVAVTLWTVLRR